MKRAGQALYALVFFLIWMAWGMLADDTPKEVLEWARATPKEAALRLSPEEYGRWKQAHLVIRRYSQTVELLIGSTIPPDASWREDGWGSRNAWCRVALEPAARTPSSGAPRQ